MRTAVLVINFGEPEEATAEAVVPFLERIFLTNASLEGRQPDDAQRARSRQLALARAPGLASAYEEIGGSPLNAQARGQSDLLERALGARGIDARCHAVFQFLEPGIDEGLSRARADGAERVVALPVYPLCGQSTTVAALEEVRRGLDRRGWDVPLHEISGWHRHPDYLPFHADHVASFCRERGLTLGKGTDLLFSIHGTPIKYLEAGNRYDRYVDETCAEIARRVSAPRYWMGYQNHTNRPIEWTEPSVTVVVDSLEGPDVVVVAPSFMHEQSETLLELDHELKAMIEARALRYHRVGIPHDAERFIRVLADLVAGSLDPSSAPDVDWRRCMCRPGGSALCTNGMRLGVGAVATAERA
jgi:protoporphyrin/coproporphyrin ferrochelatase